MFKRTNFKDLFKSAVQENMNSPGLQPGHPFPVDHIDAYAGQGPILICLISLSCGDCIELLARINKFLEQYDKTFIILANAFEEELNEIKAYFKFEFPLIPITEEEVRRTYAPPVTPYSYYVNNNGIIVACDAVHNEEELLGLIKHN